MIAFFGLGNVGSKFKDTKHNAGFWVLDELAKRYNLHFKPGKGDYVFVHNLKKDLILIKPTIGMNKSGVVVKEVTGHFGLIVSEIFIVVDDVDLSLGKIRIRPKGGDGCHRGLKDIIYQLQSNQFPRVRLGIATEVNMRPAEEYVLKPFQEKDLPDVKFMVKLGADALENILNEGLSYTMNHFNC